MRIHIPIKEILMILETGDIGPGRVLKTDKIVTLSGSDLNTCLEKARALQDAEITGSYYVEYSTEIRRGPFKNSVFLNSIFIEMTSESGGIIQELL